MSRISLASAVVVAACSRGAAPQELLTWAEDPRHGLVQSAQVGGYRITARYEPARLRLARELDLEVTAPAEAEARLQELAMAEAIQLQLEAGAPGADLADLAAHADAICAGLQLQIGAQDTPCRLALPEQAGGVAPRLSWAVAFDAVDGARGDRTLLVRWSPPLADPVNLHFAELDLEALPELEISP